MEILFIKLYYFTDHIMKTIKKYNEKLLGKYVIIE